MKLIPMTCADFQTFRERSIAGYAKDVARTYGLPEGPALARANANFHAELPDGLATEDHHLFHLCREDSTPVGIVWLGVIRDAPLPATLFVYDLEIVPAFRRRGWASRALQAIEHWGRERGLKRLELNVFADNMAALALYEAVGLTVCEMTMGKDLGCLGRVDEK